MKGRFSLNVTKKVIAVIVIAVILIRAFTIEAFALAGAPVIAAEEITALLETALIGSGLYNESELDGKNYNELNDLLKDGINSGQINPKVNYFTDPITEIKFSLLELLTKPEVQAGIGVSNAILSSIADDVISDFFSDYTKLSDSVVPTPTTDLNGSGALFEWYNPSGYLMKRAYCEYIIRYSSGDFRCYGDIRDINYNPNGTIQSEKKYPYGGTGKYYSWTSMLEYQKFYGDVRYEDGTQAETDDEAIPVIGETDGTQVTPDMLNPDGTVTIDGTTYYPKDFIDWDKFKDPAIIDLLNQILNKIDDIDVIEPDTTKDLVDSITDSVDISVSEELSDYMMPTGISSVFPFCLPFDLYRGIRLLSVKPVAPVLEIPFEVPEFGLFKGYKTTLTIEFEKYDKYFSVFRWGIYFIFALGLVFISTKIVKGAGA